MVTVAYIRRCGVNTFHLRQFPPVMAFQLLRFFLQSSAHGLVINFDLRDSHTIGFAAFG